MNHLVFNLHIYSKWTTCGATAKALTKSIRPVLKERPRSSLSGIKPTASTQPAARVGGTDSDGDNDGLNRGAAKATPPTTPVVSKPTEAKGNNVKTYA